MSEPQRVVYVVDDDQDVLEAIADLVDSVGIEAKIYNSPTAFLAEFDPSWTGCLILDIRMPGMSGTDLQAELQRRNCMLPIIFLTGHGDIPMAVGAMRAGALDFMPKPFRESELLESIELAFQRQQTIADKQALSSSIARRIERLTPREKEVMDRIVQGHSSKVIAIDLNLSPRTVEAHRAHIMEKMQARSLADLVRTAMLSE